MRDNERMKIAFERAAINAALLAGYVGADLEKTDFLPMAYEFSTDANNCGLHVKAERDAIINGRIDRIDRAEKGGEEFLRIVDYKTGSKEYSYENLRTGIDLQLPLYLRAVTADESKQPGGFIYLSSAMPKITLGSASELEDKERLNALLVSKITASGVINSLFSHKKSSKLASYSKEQINELLDDAERVIENSVNSMTYGYFNAEPACINKKYPCEYCSFATVCRRRRYSKD